MGGQCDTQKCKNLQGHSVAVPVDLGSVAERSSCRMSVTRGRSCDAAAAAADVVVVLLLMRTGERLCPPGRVLSLSQKGSAVDSEGPVLFAARLSLAGLLSLSLSLLKATESSWSRASC